MENKSFHLCSLENLLIPRTFAQPVKYYAQKSAWINTAIFTDWFHSEFVPSVKKYLVAEINLWRLFFCWAMHPLIVTLRAVLRIPLLSYQPITHQPMDQGVLVTLERHLKRRVLDEDGTINIKDVAHTSADSRAKSWMNCRESSSTLNTWLKNLLNHWGKTLTEDDISSWIEADTSDPGHQLYTDEEIISVRIGGCSWLEDVPSEDDGEEESPQSPTSGKAADMHDT